MSGEHPAVRVDVHSHMLPDEALRSMPAGLRLRGSHVLEAIRSRSLSRGVADDLRSLERHRARQAEHSVDLSVIGPWMDAVKLPADPKLQQAWCRSLTEAFADLVVGTEHSCFVAALPDHDGGAAADELEYAMSRGAVGGMLVANPELGTLERHDLDALWGAAERLGAPIILHPANIDIDPKARRNQANFVVVNPFETTLAAYHLICAGVPDRFSDLKIVLVHGGGFFPFQYGRLIQGIARLPELSAIGVRSAQEYLRWFHYDSVLFEAEPLAYLIDLVGVDRVLAGSDCPMPMTDYLGFGPLTAGLGLSAQEEAAVMGTNALELFRLGDWLVSTTTEEASGETVTR